MTDGTQGGYDPYDPYASYSPYGYGGVHTTAPDATEQLNPYGAAYGHYAYPADVPCPAYAGYAEPSGAYAPEAGGDPWSGACAAGPAFASPDDVVTTEFSLPAPSAPPEGEAVPAPRTGPTRAERRRRARRRTRPLVAAPLAVAGAAAMAVAAYGTVQGFGSTPHASATGDDAGAGPQPSAAANSGAASRAGAENVQVVPDAQQQAAAEQEQAREQQQAAEQQQQLAAQQRAQQAAAQRPKFALPVPDVGISAYFGSSGEHWQHTHTGIDFPVSYGTPVHAAMDGVVSTRWNRAYGNMVIVTAKDGTETWYCHLSRAKVRSGAVKAGDVIAYSGNSGNSTGPHLHFEVRPDGGAPQNPLPWLRARGLDPTG